jgi:hypothetical protein
MSNSPFWRCHLFLCLARPLCPPATRKRLKFLPPPPSSTNHCGTDGTPSNHLSERLGTSTLISLNTVKKFVGGTTCHSPTESSLNGGRHIDLAGDFSHVKAEVPLLIQPRARIPAVHTPPADLWQVRSSESNHTSLFLASSIATPHPLAESPKKLFGQSPQALFQSEEPSGLLRPLPSLISSEKSNQHVSPTLLARTCPRDYLDSELEVSYLRSTSLLEQEAPRRPPSPSKSTIFVVKPRSPPGQYSLRCYPRGELEHLVLQYTHNVHAPRTVSPLSPLRSPMTNPFCKTAPMMTTRAGSPMSSNYSRTVGELKRQRRSGRLNYLRHSHTDFFFRKSACERKRRDLRDESSHCIECRREPLRKRLLAHKTKVQRASAKLPSINDCDDNHDLDDDMMSPESPYMEAWHDFDVGEDLGDFFHIEMDEGGGNLF